MSPAYRQVPSGRCRGRCARSLLKGSVFRRSIVCHLSQAFAALCLLTSCRHPTPDRVQGYVEGEFVYIASPLAGALDTLHVQRGQSVNAGDPLFGLQDTSERASRDEAQRHLAQARANLEDARKGRRQPEIAAIEAQLEQARAARAFSEKEFARQEELFRTGAAARQEIDRARSANEQDRQKVAQLEAELKTAQLGARSDQIEAAEANVQAQEAMLVKAEWDLGQKKQCAPQAGLVFDTLFRQGEWVPAGRPVIVLLPPANIKVRAFIPETRIGMVQLRSAVDVIVDGASEPFSGHVSFISPRAEYTPPVIYSRESRAKLVFMIEIVFDPKTSPKLHPGQPVDVQFHH